MIHSIQQVTHALQQSWATDTSFDGDVLSAGNPARGQCVVSSLVMQDYVGGDLARARVTGQGIDEKHYYNVLDDGTVIDTTGQQYGDMNVSFAPASVDLMGKYGTIRDKLLDDKDTLHRYSILKQRVDQFFGDKEGWESGR